jgi:hypothetical protein
MTAAGPSPSVGGGRPLDAAIFVGGMPRSGTSLMRAILDAHPDVAMFPGELPLWRHLAPVHAGLDLGRAAARDRLIRALVSHPSVKRAGDAIDGRALAATLAAEPAVRLGTVFAHALRQCADRAGKPRWGVKDPRSEFHADRILAELPAASMVHMIRDPRDVLASQRATWGRAAQHIVSTVADWRRSADIARRRQGAGYVVVRYEDLVAEPAQVVGRVCRALGLDYRPEMLDAAGRPLWPGVVAPPGWTITRESVGRYRADLAAADIRYIEWRAAREMRTWGYVPGRRCDGGDWRHVARCLAEEGAWRALRALGIWPLVSRALGRAPPGS